MMQKKNSEKNKKFFWIYCTTKAPTKEEEFIISVSMKAIID